MAQVIGAELGLKTVGGMAKRCGHYARIGDDHVEGFTLCEQFVGACAHAFEAGEIEFNEPDDPQYSDFAYLAFTIGMTFQVSDTNIKTKQIRRIALRHALMSFPLGAVIIATSINLVAGLAK